MKEVCGGARVGGGSWGYSRGTGRGNGRAGGGACGWGQQGMGRRTVRAGPGLEVRLGRVEQVGHALLVDLEE